MDIPIELVLEDMFSTRVYREKSIEEALDTRIGKNVYIQGKICVCLKLEYLTISLENKYPLLSEEEDTSELIMVYSPEMGLSEKELKDIAENLGENETEVKVYGTLEEIIVREEKKKILKLQGISWEEPNPERHPNKKMVDEVRERFPYDDDFVVFQNAEKEYTKKVNSTGNKISEAFERDFALRSFYQKFSNTQQKLKEEMERESEGLVSIEEKSTEDYNIPLSELK